jgi:hypothetical protein
MREKYIFPPPQDVICSTQLIRHILVFKLSILYLSFNLDLQWQYCQIRNDSHHALVSEVTYKYVLFNTTLRIYSRRADQTSV